MPVFVCDQCGCVENTATSRFWLTFRPLQGITIALCSECDPAIGKWHGKFEKKQWNGVTPMFNKHPIVPLKAAETK